MAAAQRLENLICICRVGRDDFFSITGNKLRYNFLEGVSGRDSMPACPLVISPSGQPESKSTASQPEWYVGLCGFSVFHKGVGGVLPYLGCRPQQPRWGSRPSEQPGGERGLGLQPQIGLQYGVWCRGVPCAGTPRAFGARTCSSRPPSVGRWP